MIKIQKREEGEKEEKEKKKIFLKKFSIAGECGKDNN